MATAVERSLPDTTNREIIDVDEFDFSHQQMQGQRSREQIYFVNSDGEEELIEILSPRLQPSSINGSRPTRHYVPGGPRRDPSIPPPVPAIPARFQALPTSFPRRRQAQSTGLPNLPPVIPSQEPLAFESFGSSSGGHAAASPAPVAGPSTSRSGPPQAAPSSHHIPSMGLGGALISNNRRESQQRQRAQLAAEMQRRNRALLLRTFGPEDIGPSSGLSPGAGSNSTGAASGGSRRRRWHNFGNNFEELLTGEDDHAHAQHIHLLLNPGPAPLPSSSTWQSTGMSWHDLAMGHTHMGAAAEARDKEQYQLRYTHPLRPEPGFTFDFDCAQADAPIVLDDDGDIVTPDLQVTSSLVCARCTEPLVLNAAMAEEEAASRRIWALRCGHLIDEKCLNEIGRPNDEQLPQAPAEADRKGKGKAKAAPLSSPFRAEPAQPPLPPVVEQTEAGGISSRLRSRFAATASALYSMVDPSASQAQVTESPPRPPPAKKRRVTKRKPKIEGTFMWPCPVASCRREHVSVKIDGVWGPEKEVPTTGGKKVALAATSQEPRGAMAVFA